MFNVAKKKKNKQKHLKPGVIQGEAIPGKMTRKKKAVIVGVVVMVAFSLGVGFALYKNITKDESKEQEIAMTEFTTLEDQTYSLQGDDKTDEAIRLWEEYLAQPPRLEFRPAAMVRIGSLLLNVDKSQEALGWFQKANGIEESNASVVGIAFSAEATGNKNLAIEYYRKAIKLEKKFQEKVGPNNDDYLQSQTNQREYEQTIIKLEAQP